MGITITLKGLPELNEKIKTWTEEKKKGVQQGILQASFYLQGEIVESVAGHRAEIRSVDTGRFMGSIKAVSLSPFTVSVETNVEYAKFLEYGTTKIEPRMHFRNTLTRGQNKIIEYIKDKIK